MQIVDQHAPIKIKRIRNSFAPWLSSELKGLMHQRDHFKRIATVTENDAGWIAYKHARNVTS